MSNDGEVIRFNSGESARLLDTKAMRREEDIKLENQAHAKAIFGDDFFGPEEVKKEFGIEISQKIVPDIQFSEEELKGAKELGQRLILRVDKTPDGRPLTMEWLDDTLNPNVSELHNGAPLLDESNKYIKKDFWTADTPRTGWALVSKKGVPRSAGRTYIGQSRALAEYIRDIVFKVMKLPKEYEEAIKDFERAEPGMESLVGKGYDNPSDENIAVVARRLAHMRLTQLTRPTAVEAMYDMLIDSRPITRPNQFYVWTSSVDTCKFIYLMNSSTGLYMNKTKIYGTTPLYWGAVLSRRV